MSGRLGVQSTWPADAWNKSLYSVSTVIDTSLASGSMPRSSVEETQHPLNLPFRNLQTVAETVT